MQVPLPHRIRKWKLCVLRADMEVACRIRTLQPLPHTVVKGCQGARFWFRHITIAFDQAAQRLQGFMLLFVAVAVLVPTQ